MAGLQTTLQLRKMRRDWERRARENPRHYVLTGKSHWTDEEFYRSGEVTLQEDILNDLTNICQGRDPKAMAVLEIGCGAGRVTRAFANFFGSVWAVDISGEMVRQAKLAVAEFPNAHVFQNNGKDLSVIRKAPQFDFAFSSMVFQHIPNREIIESYVRGVDALLRPGSLFKFQVQGGAPRPAGVPADTWVGWSFTTQDARAMAARCGFEMRYEAGAGEQYYWLWFFKSSRP